jgi:hypothetical protein
MSPTKEKLLATCEEFGHWPIPLSIFKAAWGGKTYVKCGRCKMGFEMNAGMEISEHPDLDPVPSAAGNA